MDLSSIAALRPEPLAVGRARQYCAGIVRRSHSSFASTFWMLPPQKRYALQGIYAFCRLADDIADLPEVGGDRRALLNRWRQVLDEAYAGDPSHPVGVALGEAIRRYALPRHAFEDLLSGIESDLRAEPVETVTQLYRYCYQVASTVGILVVHVLGFRNPRSLDYARTMGIAVQLTNVLRDVGEDAARGRIYLAREDMERLGVDPRRLLQRRPDESVRLLLALNAERARIHYERARRLLPPEDRRALRPAEAMGAIYRSLLEELQRRGFPCLEQRLRLSRPRRLAIAAAAWLGLEGML